MNNKVYEDSIILIGPSHAGKSTIAELLKEKTGMRRICLDAYSKTPNCQSIIGGIREDAKARGENPNDEAHLALINLLLKMAEDYNQPGIVDFGAGHAIFTKEGLTKAKELLKHFKNIVLLLPCEDKEKSIHILASRDAKGDVRDNRVFIENPSYYELATMTFYNEGKSPEQVADEIMSTISGRDEKKAVRE